MRKNLQEYGSVVQPPNGPNGRRPILDDEKENDLLRFLEDRPTAYLFEMVYYLFDKYDGLKITEKSVGNVLRRCGWTRKKVSPLSSS